MISLEKRVLRDVVGVACLARQVERQGVDARTVGADQLIEGRASPALARATSSAASAPRRCASVMDVSCFNRPPFVQDP